jgi:hypothetical protein
MAPETPIERVQSMDARAFSADELDDKAAATQDAIADLTHPLDLRGFPCRIRSEDRHEVVGGTVCSGNGLESSEAPSERRRRAISDRAKRGVCCREDRFLRYLPYLTACPVRSSTAQDRPRSADPDPPVGVRPDCAMTKSGNLQERAAMEHQMRRLVPRQVTNWRGKYMIEGEPDERWRDCRVIDVSSAGAGIELLDATPEKTEGRQIILAVHLRATVRNSGPARGEILRVGTQFVDLSAAEFAYLASLAEVNAYW